MSDYISQTLRTQIATRADHSCEYCQTAQEISGSQMHVEHIIPRSKGGSSDERNLCLSCAWCNSFKGTKTHGTDPDTDRKISLFNPRHQTWHDHFRWNDDGFTIIGKTPTGRATIGALNMNNKFIIPARAHWVEAGWHPPDQK